MKSLLLLTLSVACGLAQPGGPSAPSITVGPDAPSPAACGPQSIGSVYVRSESAENGPIGVSRCTQVGALSYAWQPIGHFVGATLPAKCSAGDIAFDSDASAGQNVYGCTSTNTWTLQSGSGSWTRDGTTISPATAGDSVEIGDIELHPTTGIKGPIFACTGTPGDTTAPFRAFCITTAGSAYVCVNAVGCVLAEDWVAQTGASYPGVTSYEENGLEIAGSLVIGGTQPTRIITTGTLINDLPGNAGCAAWRTAWNLAHPSEQLAAGWCTPVNTEWMRILDGATPIDSTVGGGTNKHWVYYDGAAWVADNTNALTASSPLSWNSSTRTLTCPTCTTYSAPSTISASCSGAQNWAVGSVFSASGTLTLTGSCTLTASGMVEGGFYTVKVVQDAVGSNTLTLGTGGTGGCSAWKVGGGGGGAVTPTAAANSQDILAIWYVGGVCMANYRGNFD